MQHCKLTFITSLPASLLTVCLLFRYTITASRPFTRPTDFDITSQTCHLQHQPFPQPAQCSSKMQGFNMGKYVPPDLEGTTSGNKLHGKHALGGRASKLASQGILTVRFEMPYAVWCSTCPKPTIIGQGVRFNAAKQKVGAYHSTPIWSFKMRHAACGGEIEIRTDPANTAYVVVAGGKKRDTGEDQVHEGDSVILTDQEREALRQNAFASLEKTIEDRAAAKASTERIDDLLDVAARQWDDPYTLNQKLRKTFRAERKDLEKTAAKDESLKNTMGLGIDLLPESEGDRLRASLVAFDKGDDSGRGALAKPLFSSAATKEDKKKPLLKADKAKMDSKGTLVSTFVHNTRASSDPFLRPRTRSTKEKAIIPGVKRKRDEQESKAIKAPAVDVSTTLSKPAGLVDYDSD